MKEKWLPEQSSSPVPVSRFTITGSSGNILYIRFMFYPVNLHTYRNVHIRGLQLLLMEYEAHC